MACTIKVLGAEPFRAIGRSIIAFLGFKLPLTIARYVFFVVLSENCFCSFYAVSSFFAPIMTPDVSLSRR